MDAKANLFKCGNNTSAMQPTIGINKVYVLGRANNQSHAD